MKQVVFILLDRFADCEFAYLAPALRVGVAQGYEVCFVSTANFA